MEQWSESELIERILDGEHKAFSVLIKRYQHQLHALIRKIVPDREDAEELTQDVFVKAFSKLGSFRRDSSLSTWLYRIAYNTAISATRKKKHFYRDFDDKTLNNLPDETVGELLNQEDNEQLLKKMEEAIGMLKPEERALISLYYTQERSVAELSAITGMTQENVKVKLFRVRKKIVLLMKC
jgi:RNA polymerase sigma-70 factor, ECF subfamily